MKTLTALIGLGVLSIACSNSVNPVEDAKTKYEIVKKSGDKLETCERSRNLAELYLANTMEKEYLAQKAALDEECTYTYEEATGTK
jgi:hypothetical protein